MDQKRVIVDSINIEGLKKTRHQVLSSLVKGLENSSTFRELTEKLVDFKLSADNLQIFDSVQFFIDQSNDAKYDQFKNSSVIPVDVNIYVEESRSLCASIKTQYDMTQSTTLATSLMYKNLTGRADVVSLNYTKSSTESVSTFNLAYTKPNYTNILKNWNVELFNKSLNFGEPSNLTKVLGLICSYQFPSIIGLHNVGYERSLRLNNNFNLNRPFSIRNSAGQFLKSMLFHSFVYDSRDDDLFPSSGVLLRLIQDLSDPFQGDLAFFRNKFKFEAHCEFPRLKDHVLSLVNELNLIRTFGANSTRSMCNDRFYIGGPLNLRGFAFNSVGSVSSNHYLGGDLLAMLGLHYTFPIPFSDTFQFIRKHFRLHFYMNMAKLFLPDKSDKSMYYVFSSLYNEKTRFAYGFGISAKILGILKFEFCYSIPVVYDSNDKLNHGFSVGLGTEFL